MASFSTVIYHGNLKTTARYQDTDTTVNTEMVMDGSKQSTFEPTDLLAAALGACTLSMIGFLGEREQLNLEGLSVKITKETTDVLPKRITVLSCDITFPQGLVLTDVQKQKLERSVAGCPVRAALNPEIKINETFSYPQ